MRAVATQRRPFGDAHPPNNYTSLLASSLTLTQQNLEHVQYWTRGRRLAPSCRKAVIKCSGRSRARVLQSGGSCTFGCRAGYGLNGTMQRTHEGDQSPSYPFFSNSGERTPSQRVASSLGEHAR